MSNQRIITVHDRCIGPGCNRVLHSLAEAERGVCGSCHIKAMPPDTKAAMNRLLRAGFNGADDAEKDAAVDGALAKLRRDRGEV